MSILHQCERYSEDDNRDGINVKIEKDVLHITLPRTAKAEKETKRIEVQESLLRLSKSFHWCRLNLSLQSNYTESHYSLLLNDIISSFILRSSSTTFSFSIQPAEWLSFTGSSNMGSSKQINRDDRSLDSRSLISFVHQLKMYVMPGKWQIEWSHELYHGNDDATSTNYFMDLSVSYRQKTYEIVLSLNNVIGTKTYEQHYYTTNQRIHQYNVLRPREILLSVSFDI